MSISQNMYDKVREFHTTFGLPVNDTPTLPDPESIQLRWDLLKEEYMEYVEGMIEDNRVEVADALADILYITFGTALVYGFNFFREFEDSSILRTDLEKKNAPFQDNLVFKWAHDSRNTLDHSFHLVGPLLWSLEIAGIYDIPIVEVFNEVHRSNMSKLTAEGTVLYREDGKVLKSDLYSPPDIKGVLYNYSKVVD